MIGIVDAKADAPSITGSVPTPEAGR